VSFPYTDAREAVLDVQERTLRPADPPDDADLEASPWTVTDEDTAAWAIVKIRIATEAAARRNAPALALIAEHEAEIASLRATVEANDARAQHDVDWFTIHLTRWHRERYEADTDPKHRTTTSIDLPGGVLTSRQTPGKVLSVADPEALPEGLRRVKVEPDRKAITAWVKSTGEVPEGVEWERPRRVFGVSL